MFQAFEKFCRVPEGGYVGIEDVQVVPPKQIDRMETFWMGETLSEYQSRFPGGPPQTRQDASGTLSKV